MVVKTVYVTRHGVRGTWNLNLGTGVYTSNIPSPTQIPGDPPLVAYGVQQSHELAAALAQISPPIARIYSSPYYRCLETIRPTAEKLGLKISPDNGLGYIVPELLSLDVIAYREGREFFGRASFPHPVPAQPPLLASLFPMLDTDYAPSCYPPTHGESLPQLYARLAYALSYVIADADAASGDEEIAIQICTHAASLIAIGRVLTGSMPASVDEQDFKTFTAGITRFERRTIGTENCERRNLQVGEEIPGVDWTEGKGVMGGWDCAVNCDCSHLKGGEERGWFFSGDESFHDSQISASRTDGADGGSRL